VSLTQTWQGLPFGAESTHLHPLAARQDRYCHYRKLYAVPANTLTLIQGYPKYALPTNLARGWQAQGKVHREEKTSTIIDKTNREPHDLHAGSLTRQGLPRGVAIPKTMATAEMTIAAASGERERQRLNSDSLSS
jgi:hypothetical protein